jgi:metallo-beta-lactamase family protein
MFVGFQVENTLGRKIVDGWKKVPILGEEWIVRAEIVSIQGYSAHAGRNELLDYILRIAADQRLKRVLVVHGEPQAAQALASGMEGLGIREVLIPTRMQQVEI